MSDAMPGTVWVGKVKSNAAPDMLERAFERYGTLKAVETGFAGFAFVRFLEDSDADDAVRGMHDQFIAGVGKVLAQKATHRGYKDACNKREAFRRGIRVLPGEKAPHLSPRRSRSRGRSRSSRSLSRRRQSPSRRRTPSPQKRRQRKASRGGETREARSRSRPQRSRSRSRSRSKSQSRSPLPEEGAQMDAEPPCQLTCRDRNDLLCFFSGANVLDLLLEALPVAASPGLLNGYPFAFGGLSQEDALESLEVASEFAQPSAGGSDPNEGKKKEARNVEERSIEVRQVISVDATGRRSLRKAIFVNGARSFVEQQQL